MRLIRDNDPLFLISRPSSCGNTLAAKPDSCALPPIAQLRLSMKGALSPTSVYGQVPDYAMPLKLAGRQANVVILDQVQISAGITTQDEPTRRRRVPAHALDERFLMVVGGQ
jgi:hypothetical protein